LSEKNNISSTALKALRVLETISESSAPLSVSEVAKCIGVDKTTSYRMLITLIEAGYVIRDNVSKRYILSYKVVSLSRNLLAENEVSRLIRKALIKLSKDTSETLHYSVLDNDETVLVQRVKGTQLVSIDFQIGDRSKLHCTSIGKAILAYQDYRFIERIIANGLPKITENTIVNPDEFRKELHRIRSQGYAFDNHEYSNSMRCIAVPIFESGGYVKSGISISGPDTRFSLKKLEELKKPTLDTSYELSKNLGGLAWKADIY